MIKFHARKPIRDFLNKVTEPPYTLEVEEHNSFFESIMSVYEETASTARQKFLCNDTFDLLRVFAKEDNAIKEPRDSHWLAMVEIRRMLTGIIAAADLLGVQLPESELQKHGYETLKFGVKSFAEEVRELYKARQARNEANSGTKCTGMGNNTTANPETPPAAQKTPKTMEIYTPKPVGRPTGEFANTIADTYQNKADIIQKHTGNVLASMTDPKAVIALLVVYFRNGILKQCPTYWQTLRLLDIEAEEYTDKEKLCPFGKHQQYDKQRKIYFDENDSYLSLNDTDRKQDNEISSFIQNANTIYMALLVKLNPQPQRKARKGA